MRSLFGLLCAIVLAAVPLVGCGDDSDGGTGGSGGTAGSGGAGGVTEREYAVQFSELKEDGSAPPLEGVKFCEAGTDNCGLSNEVGIATVVLPAEQEITLTIEKEGYGSWVVGDVSDENWGGRTSGSVVAPWRMHTDAQLAAIASDLQTPYPWNQGVVALLRFPTAQAGVTFAPVGSTEDDVGPPFYYDAAEEQYSLEPDATTAADEAWLLPFAMGGFVEVVPGEQQFEFGGTAGDCRPSWSWPGDGPNQIRLPVLEGYTTYASVVCE